MTPSQNDGVAGRQETLTLNVLDSAGRLLGIIEADIFRSDKLLYGAGSQGWRAWETLSLKECAEFGLAQEDPVRFERAVTSFPK